jgi:hypothetical protein
MRPGVGLQKQATRFLNHLEHFRIYGLGTIRLATGDLDVLAGEAVRRTVDVLVRVVGGWVLLRCGALSAILRESGYGGAKLHSKVSMLCDKAWPNAKRVTERLRSEDTKRNEEGEYMPTL